MILTTERLLLRPWKETDAESLYEYAKDPDVGPIAGWPVHQSIEESCEVIKHVFRGKECYAVCEKGTDLAIGAIELKLNGSTDMTERDDECELGYWIGKPFWGRGYIPEAAEELIRRGFEDLGMTTIWCGYYDGNEKSKRVQEKLGFLYHHTCNEVPVALLNEVRVEHTNYMTGNQWNGDDGYPFAFPINYFYEPESGKIYFHGAKAGHKVDALKKDDKVCFTVYGNEVHEEGDWAPYLQSVVIFGRCHLIEDSGITEAKVRELAEKYYPTKEEIDAEIAADIKAVQLYEITIEHMSGKRIHEK